MPADVRLVLEVHDLDPANPGSYAAPSTVLYDAVLAAAPGFVTYALVNSSGLHCTLAFTRLRRLSDAEVRSALAGQPYRTRLVGLLAEGAECDVNDYRELRFHPEYVPASNEAIVARYRSRGRALARVTDPASIAALARNGDDGVRGAVKRVAVPAPRTSEDCENAARALLDDAVQAPCAGEYRFWSDFLPAGDIFPGDGYLVNVPSLGPAMSAVVREVEIEMLEPAADRGRYRVAFANDAAQPLAVELDPGRLDPVEVTTTTAAAEAPFASDLPAAEVTSIASTTVAVDAGCNPPTGGGFEVRRSDSGWSATNDRNLVGRYTTRTFSVPRLSRVQTYYLRQYDASSPRRYSRYSTCLHVDYPL